METYADVQATDQYWTLHDHFREIKGAVVRDWKVVARAEAVNKSLAQKKKRFTTAPRQLRVI